MGHNGDQNKDLKRPNVTVMLRYYAINAIYFCGLYQNCIHNIVFASIIDYCTS